MPDTDATRAAFIAALQENPMDQLHRLVYADWLEEHGDEERATLLREGKIPLTEVDESAVYQLGHCHFSPGIWDKRFVRSLEQAANVKVPHVTPRMYLFLYILCRKYRRQIKPRCPSIVALAEARYERYYALHRESLLMLQDFFRPSWEKR